MIIYMMQQINILYTPHHTHTHTYTTIYTVPWSWKPHKQEYKEHCQIRSIVPNSLWKITLLHNNVNSLIFRKGYFPSIYDLTKRLLSIAYNSTILYRKSMKFGIQEELLLSVLCTKFHWLPVLNGRMARDLTFDQNCLWQSVPFQK